MHHKSWSNLRKVLEEDRLCPSLRGRVQYFMTRYHDAHDDEGRLCIRVDGKEYLNSCFMNIRYKTPDGFWHWRTKEEQIQKGLFDNLDVRKAIEKYVDELTIDDALASDDPLARLFAVLDRRVGKRRLPQLAVAMKDEPEWLRFFYRLRLEAEGLIENPVIIRFGTSADLHSWMALVRRVAWNFPGLETEEALEEHAATVAKFISKGNAICAVQGDEVNGVLLFSRRLNMLCCMAVAPEYRRRGLAQRMFDLMLTIADPERDLTVTTFREGDPKGDAPRAFYAKNGFVPGAMVMENDYPCQAFVRKGVTCSTLQN